MVVFYIGWLYLEKILIIYFEERGGDVNFLEHINTFGIKKTLFWHFKVIIENLQAHIHIKGHNNSTYSHV